MKTPLLVLLLLYSAVSQAGQSESPAAAAKPVSCGWLLTEAECMEHRRTLAGLSDPEVRLAYLERHMAMLRERETLCACASERQVLSRAQYR
jgi:hypothetical protein